MQTKITLSVTPSVVSRAKRYAKQQKGISISQMVESLSGISHEFFRPGAGSSSGSAFAPGEPEESQSERLQGASGEEVPVKRYL